MDTPCHEEDQFSVLVLIGTIVSLRRYHLPSHSIRRPFQTTMYRRGDKAHNFPSDVDHSYFQSKDRVTACSCDTYVQAMKHTPTPPRDSVPCTRWKTFLDLWAHNLSEGSTCPAIRFDDRSQLKGTNAGIEPTTSRRKFITLTFRTKVGVRAFSCGTSVQVMKHTPTVST